MKLTLAITTYNRPKMTVEAFEKVLDDPRIDEIIISDDCSSYECFEALEELLPASRKIQLYRNPKNAGMSLNKMLAVKWAKNDWVILFDSDNVIDKDYLDALEAHSLWNPKVIYCPSFARPNFDYREITLVQGPFISEDLAQKNINQFLNTCNYVVHRPTYLSTWVERKDIGEVDTIWHNYNHLKKGGWLYSVPGMEYEHKVWEGSGWSKNRKENTSRFREIKKLIVEL